MSINKILVANRGEIARRIFRTCRELGIATVAVYSDPDRSEPHAREADEAVHLPGATPAETYLDMDLVLGAAKEVGADAIHPGYGFLSENAAFAEKVIKSGLIWIGPSPEAIDIMGSKIRSKELMAEAGVPTLLSVNVTDATDLSDAGSEIGFPILVKASAGGGGKGMRIVAEPDELDAAVEAAQREAAGAFGDETVFLERYMEAPRHIEVQVFGDTHGNVISLYERECSIQRRHQKIIEEAPSPALDESTRTRLLESAVRAAESVNYVGAGTVEFLYADREHFFLEMNTRLQVEHPVTEMITGLDLVKLQIDVANEGTLEGLEVGLTGHAIEARIYAEDPRNEFLPAIGPVYDFDFDTDRLRVDSGIEAGSNVTVHYDPMLAKVIAHGDSRDEATSALAAGLRSARIHGPTTNRDLLVRVLESDRWVDGDTDTHFIDEVGLEALAAPLASEDDEQMAAVAAALADAELDRSANSIQPGVPAGWRNLGQVDQLRSFVGTRGTVDVSYRGHEVIEPAGLEVRSADDGQVTLRTSDEEVTLAVARYGLTRFVDSERVPATLDEVPRFPAVSRDEQAGSLVSPMPGKVISVNVAEGETVEVGQILILLEAMKMERAIKAPHAGQVVDVLVREGDQVEGDQVLVVVSAG